MSRRLTSLAAVAVAFAGTLTVATASPAQATTQECISFLSSVSRQTTARNQVCEVTEFLSDTVSQEYAFTTCLYLMEATGLEWYYAGNACFLATEDPA
jgi:hypothetical protein